MPDDVSIQQAIERAFRRKVAATELTEAALKTTADACLVKLTAGVTVIQMNLEGGGGSGVINCSPATLLNACETILAEIAATSAGTPGNTGAIHLDMSATRIES